MTDGVLWQSISVAVIASIPLVLAVTGELVVQRSGIINLGIEGMMLAAALGAAVAAHLTGSTAAGFAGGIAAAMVIALLFGIFTVRLRIDQIVTGTAINLVALGVTGFLNHELQRRGIFGGVLAPRGAHEIILAVVSWIAVPIGTAIVLWRTPFGLRLRACGENPDAVSAAGRSVPLHRAAALGAEAVLVGLAGADLALLLSSGFADNMTAGRGYIALAIVIFGRWKIRGAVAGSALFGLAAAMQYALQAGNRGVPFHVLLALPYVITLVTLLGVAGRVRAPEALGKR